MEGEARVLEQRIEPVAFDRHRIEPIEWVRREQQEDIEAEGDRGLGGERRA